MLQFPKIVELIFYAEHFESYFNLNLENFLGNTVKLVNQVCISYCKILQPRSLCMDLASSVDNQRQEP